MKFLTSKFCNFANKKTVLVSGKMLSYKSNRSIETKASSISIPLEGDLVKNKVITVNYSLDSFNRSNQDTCLIHRPAVYEGQWVESGDLLADCSASLGGELSLGQNILIAYMPWEGYNFEDAILISERLVYDDLFTSIHIEKYEMEIRETKLGIEQITREIPEIQTKELKNLDSSGVVILGSWVQEGDILVGKITPINKKAQSPYQKLLYTILEKQFLPIRDSSLRAPKSIKAKVIGIQIFKNENSTSSTKLKKKTTQVSKKLKILTNSKKINKTNGLVKTQDNLKKVNPRFYLEESKDKNSLGFKTLSGNTQNSLFKKSKFFFNSKGLFFNNKIKDSNSDLQNFTNEKRFDLKNSLIYAMNKVKPIKHKFKNETPCKGKKIESNKNLADIYFLKKLQAYAFARSKKILEKYKNFDIDKNYNQEIIIPSKHNSLKEPLINSHTGLKTANIKLLPSGFTKNCRFLPAELFFKKKSKKKSLNNISLSSIHIFLAEKRTVQIGDKMAGRHGNKGIISQILPREDMPYLPDGTPLDMILNPLGVPSRMNVGQIYECLLGFAGKYLGENFKVFPFDEIYGPEASRSFVYSKLFEARVKTGLDWLYDPNSPGKIRLYDGRTGESFDQAITVGDSYMLRLVHMVDDKIHCLTSDHDVLTSEGWLPIANVKMDHEVATLTRNGELVYQKPTKVLHFHDYSGKLYNITNSHIDLTVTLNHRMYVREIDLHKDSFDGYELKTAETIKKQHYQYLKNASWLKQDYQLTLRSATYNSSVITEDQVDMDVWLDFFGLWIAQDLATPNRPVLRLGYDFRVVDDKLTIYDKQLVDLNRPSIGASNKTLPSWVWQLSQRQANKLLEIMCLKSGKQDGSSLKFYTSSVKLADDVMRLALHAGWSGNKDYHGYMPSPKGQQILMWCISINHLNKDNNPEVNDPDDPFLKDSQKEKIKKYEGSVYCLSVPNEVFYVRKNGRSIWTGNSRSTGPYSLVTQQPLRGRSKQGGQRLGEMEVWALEGYGAAFTLLEMLTIKSDDMSGRITLWSNLILNKDISIGTPESFKVLVSELRALCIDIRLFRLDPISTSGIKEVSKLIDLA